MPEREAVLVTGGAGYVGAAVVRALSRAGHRPVVVDDLSAGHRQAIAGVPILRARCGEIGKIAAFARRHRTRAAVHAAASCLVGESVEHPAKYYQNNVAQGLALLEALRAAGVRRLIFSSSAAVYGEPQSMPIHEDHPQRPINPYGETKSTFEQALRWHCPAYGMVAVALRFFNAAGADPDGRFGEDHDPETHLIPRILRHALGQCSHVSLYGTDYPTPDGTAVRDFVHVDDLAEAHLLALERCREPGCFVALNLGSGSGSSVREVLSCAERVVGRSLRVREEPRRAGDPAFLVASNERAREVLGWRPRLSLGEIVGSAWKWHSSHPGGYARSSARGSTRLVRARNAVIRSRARSAK